jgi:hypothetical protein
MIRAQCLLLIALATPSLASAAGMTPQDVKVEVESLGAQKTVADLNAHGGRRWDAFLRGVQSGRGDWLALVPAIKSGTDAGTAEGLQIAVSMALSRNAAGVLALTPATYALSALCIVPLIEPTDAQVTTYKRRTLSGLDKASSGSAANKVQECRRLLTEKR